MYRTKLMFPNPRVKILSYISRSYKQRARARSGWSANNLDQLKDKKVPLIESRQFVKHSLEGTLDIAVATPVPSALPDSVHTTDMFI